MENGTQNNSVLCSFLYIFQDAPRSQYKITKALLKQSASSQYDVLLTVISFFYFQCSIFLSLGFVIHTYEDSTFCVNNIVTHKINVSKLA